MSEVLLVAYDDDDGGRRAVDYAATRAKAAGAKLLLVHVLQWSPYSFLTQEELATRHKAREQEIGRAREAVVEPMLKRLRDQGLEVEALLRHGNAPEVICDIAEERKVSHIAVGRTGSSRLSDRLFGSVPSALVQAAPVPVTVVP